MLEWAQWFEDYESRKLAFNEIDGYQISTIFLGLSHGHVNGKPILWETLVTDKDGASGIMKRYTSATDALKGHREEVKRLSISIDNVVSVDGNALNSRLSKIIATTSKNMIFLLL